LTQNLALSFYLLLGFRSVSFSNEILLSNFPVVAACHALMLRMEKVASKYEKLLRMQQRTCERWWSSWFEIDGCCTTVCCKEGVLLHWVLGRS